MTIAITLADTSCLWHFLNSLQAISLLENLLTLSLMSLITMTLLSRLVLKYTFTSSVISFSRALLSRYYSGCTLTFGSPVILETNATSIYTGLSIHMMPPCTRVTNCLTQSLTFLPHPKCGISNRSIMPKLYSLVIHYASSIIGLPRGPISPVFIR
jgi:hypothetical protein